MLFFDKHRKYFQAAIPILALLLYANTFTNDYNLDDELVTINHRTTSKGFSGVKEIFTSFYYEDASGYKYDYRPITLLSFAMENQFFGEKPIVSHIINVLIYTLLSFLLYSFLSELFPQKLALLAWLATIIFVFHPLHTEVVASIKNRDEILALSFVISAGIFMLKGVDQKKWFYHLFSLVFFFLALLSKITILSFIVILPVSIILFRNINWKTWILVCVPISLIGIYCSFLSTNQKIILLFASLVFLFLLKEFKDKGALIKAFFSFIAKTFYVFLNLLVKVYTETTGAIVGFLNRTKDSSTKTIVSIGEQITLWKQKSMLVAPAWFTEKPVFKTPFENTLLASILSCLLISGIFVSFYLKQYLLLQGLFLILILLISFLFYKNNLILFVASLLASSLVFMEMGFSQIYPMSVLLLYLSTYLFKTNKRQSILIVLVGVINVFLFLFIKDTNVSNIIPLAIGITLFSGTFFYKNKYYNNALVFIWVAMAMVIIGLSFIRIVFIPEALHGYTLISFGLFSIFLFYKIVQSEMKYLNLFRAVFILAFAISQGLNISSNVLFKDYKEFNTSPIIQPPPPPPQFDVNQLTKKINELTSI